VRWAVLVRARTNAPPAPASPAGGLLHLIGSTVRRLNARVTALHSTGLTALCLLAIGCGSSSSGTPSATDAGPPNGLSGVYVTTDDGALQQFQFVDSSHVNVWWSYCADGNACESETTYTLDGSQMVIQDPLGNVTTLDVSGLEQQPTTQSDDLRVQGGVSLTPGAGGGLTTAQVALILAFDIKLLAQASSGSGSGKPCAASQHFSASSTFPNDRTAFDYFRSHGLSAAQAAGIVGNLDQESGNDPTKYQYDNGPGRGIAQWTSGGRAGDRWDGPGNDSAVAYASTEHASVWSLRTQLDFIWYELTKVGSDGLSSLKQQSSVDGAESVFQSKFEACGACDASQRIQYAQAAYNAFSKDPVSSGSGSCTQSYGTCSALGESGSCIDTAACGGSGGESTPGYCPGPSNVQCCTKHASSGGGGGASASGSSIATLALANVGKGACSTNSKEGHGFESSCDGDDGRPEYWCADFAIWVWSQAGMNTSSLTAAAGTFYCYGQDHGTLHSSPAVGDAVVFNYKGACVADHVAIVTRLNSDGTIETASGDWGGNINLSENAFSGQSHVVLNAPAYAGREGTTPIEMGMPISGFISPVK